MKFDFLKQAGCVSTLLECCIDAIPHLRGASKDALVEAMREFEKNTAPLSWNAADTDPSSESGLTEREQIEALRLFADNVQPAEDDWSALEGAGREVRLRRIPHINVHFFNGYDRSEFREVPVPDRSTWRTVLIPLSMTEIGSPSGILSKSDIVDLAFMRMTKLDPRQITEVEEAIVNQYGEAIDAYLADAAAPTLKAYRVSMTDQPGDKFIVHYDCLAEDDDDAADQAEAALPGRQAFHTTVI